MSHFKRIKTSIFKDKGLIYIVTARIFQVIISFLSLKLLTFYLSVDEVGNYYLLLTILSFFNLVFLNPPATYFKRSILEWKKTNNLLNNFFILVLWIIIVGFSSIFVTIYLYSLAGYDTKFRLDLFSTYFFLSIIIGTTFRNLLNGINILGKRKFFSIYLILSLVFGIIFSVIFINVFNARSIFWLLGFTFSEVILIFFLFKSFDNSKIVLNNILKHFSKIKIKRILKFCLPIGFTTFLIWGQDMAYRFIVDFKYSTEILAEIAVGLAISSSVFSSIEIISNQYFNPIYLKKILGVNKFGRTNAWNQLARNLTPIYFLALIFTICSSEILIQILTDKKYTQSFIFVVLGSFKEFFRVMTNLVNKVSAWEYNTIYTIKPFLIGITITMFLLFSFDFNDHLYMIPLSLAVAYFVIFIISFLQMKKLLPIEIKIPTIKILLLSLPLNIMWFISNQISLIMSIFYMVVFGLYFLYCIWFLNSKTFSIK